jgi:hypothetical protein
LGSGFKKYLIQNCKAIGKIDSGIDFAEEIALSRTANFFSGYFLIFFYWSFFAVAASKALKKKLALACNSSKDSKRRVLSGKHVSA